MKKSTIVNLNKSKLFNSFKHNYLMIIFAGVFIIGIVFGVLWVNRSANIASIAAENFAIYKQIRTTSGIFRVCLSSIFEVLPFALIVFLCGTSLVGVALTPITICYYGFQYGVFSGFLYMNFLFKGIAFNSLLLIPCTLFAIFGLISAGKLAFNFSLLLAKISLPKGQSVNLYEYFQVYCKRFLITLILFLISAVVDAVMSVSFINFFDF